MRYSVNSAKGAFLDAGLKTANQNGERTCTTVTVCDVQARGSICIVDPASLLISKKNDICD